MMKYLNLSLFLIAVIIFSGCNLDVNTSDPQESPNIYQSKKDKLFLSGYELKNIEIPVFKIKEAWMEKCWKWKLNYSFFKEKKEIDCYQLNLLLDSFINPNFKDSQYGIKWEMENELNGYFSSSGNLYSLTLKQKILPDTFNIIVVQINEDRTTKIFEHFTVKKKFETQ